MFRQLPLACQYIQSRIQDSASTKHPITRLSLVKNMTQSRLVVALLEDHTNSALTLELATVLQEMLAVDVIALEFPIMRTGYLEAGEYKGDRFSNGRLDKTYTKNLKILCEQAKTRNVPVVCHDEPSADLLPLFVAQHLQLMKEKGFTEEAATDYIRDDIMVNTLYHFTSAKRILSINGSSHSIDLMEKIQQMDSTGIFVSLEIDFTNKRSPAHVETVKSTKSKPTQLIIHAPDADSLFEKDILDKIVTHIKEQESKAAAVKAPPSATPLVHHQGNSATFFKCEYNISFDLRPSFNAGIMKRPLDHVKKDELFLQWLAREEQQQPETSAPSSETTKMEM